MRCIEISFLVACKKLLKLSNLNMRCIEIDCDASGNIRLSQSNLNMRCIEINAYMAKSGMSKEVEP